jgi:opacity protein-like surface antigen
MKKIMILGALALGISFGANAQKPESSSFSLEATLGIDGTPVGTPTFGGANTPSLRGRYFLDDKMAVRAQLGFWTDNFSQPATEPYISRIGRYDRQTVNYGLGAGMEMHMGGTDRLSPYVGGQLNWNRAITNHEWMDSEGNPWGSPTLKPGASRIITSATNTWGLDFLAGMDYYFAQNVYVGVEIGYNLSLRVEGDQTDVNTGDPVDVQENNTFYSITPGSVSGLRLGWRF